MMSSCQSFGRLSSGSLAMMAGKVAQSANKASASSCTCSAAARVQGSVICQACGWAGGEGRLAMEAALADLMIYGREQMLVRSPFALSEVEVLVRAKRESLASARL